ncbi:EthD domain-containing protein [Sphingobium sp.]|uniref:7-beta-hydroxysteroid dehydratase Hsh3 n=1 Tax=Sphingobium sp. TaxID=1912891 RepID=UPI0028BF20F7|nr:EthD domain-containing protein [Sphingobium sp.]
MEKLICALWAPEGVNRADYAARLVATLPGALKAARASSIRLNVRDATVGPAAPLNQQWQERQQDAVAQFWLPSANAIFREAVDDVLTTQSSRFEAWLVAESTIIPNAAHPPQAGSRTWGWSQASFISFLPDMRWQDAVSHWHRHHTRVAIDTQSNFEYVQNIIVRPLTGNAPAYGAFVEECFPLEAMTDPRAFFDAMGDDAKFAHNSREMTDSCAGFIDFGRIDVIPTSQFDFAHLDAA